MKQMRKTIKGFLKKLAVLAIPLLLFLSANTSLSAQLRQDIQEKLEVITQYAISANDNTNNYLELLGYEKPAYISTQEWNRFPAMRKIDMAYKAAQAKGQGNQFIEAFAKTVSADYNSIKSEKSLAQLFTNNQVPKVNFSNPSSAAGFEKIPVPAKLKGQITTLCSYVNDGALGSMQTVLSHYLNLNEATTYDILTKSENNQTAFEQGLLRSGEPPPHETKLANMANDLQNHYKALQQDKDLSDISKRSNRTRSFFNDQAKADEIKLPNHAGGGGSKGLNMAEAKKTFRPSYDKFNTYHKKNYKSGGTSFRKMRGFRGGFGGVIFGDSLKFKTSPVLKEVRWQPINDSEKDDFKKTGYLKLYFDNNAIKTYGPVLYEDVFAAHSIVNDSSYRYGNGIGMVSIIDNSNLSFSNNLRRFGITLHPAISHLRLGYAFAVVDALASAHNSFKNVIDNNSDKTILDSFYKEKNVTWKITDKQLRVGMENNKISFEQIALAMWGFRNNDTIPVQSKNFNRLLPAICRNVEEFNRVNEFTKVFAIFRWAKQVKSKVSNVTTYNSFIKQPISIVVNPNQELEFFNAGKDYAAINTEKNLYIRFLEFNKTDTNRIYAAKIDSLLNWYRRLSSARNKHWNSIISNAAPGSSNLPVYFNTEDTSALAIMDRLYLNYREKWMENNVRLIVPDSLSYYKAERKKADKYLEPLYITQAKIDSIQKINLAIFDKYSIKTAADLRKKLDYMSERDYNTVVRNVQTTKSLRTDEMFFTITPAYSKALDIRQNIANFNYRHGIVSLGSFYTLINAEKLIMQDYYSQN